MQHTIFFDDRPLILTDDPGKDLPLKDVELIKNPEAKQILQVLKKMQDAQSKAIVVEHGDLKKLLQQFKDAMKVIVAGGGFVVRDDGKLLLIFRKKKWDLPKGKLDKGEQMEDAALREVAEETGVKGLQLVKPITISYHSYMEKGETVLKESHWFLMRTNDHDDLQPQTEEEIEECRWVEEKDVKQYFSNAHASVIQVIEKGIGML